MSTSYLVKQVHADLETPVSAYLKLGADEPWSFLLESVEGRERWAAYSVIGVGARRVLTVEGGKLTTTRGGVSQVDDATDPLAALRRAYNHAEPPAGTPPFVGGIFGFLAYDAVR